MRRVTALACVVVCLLSVTLTAQERGLQPADFYKEKTVTDVALSPAGDLIAFTVMSILEEDNRRHSEIWMQRLAAGKPDGEPFRFTSPTEESSSPSWSPDGGLLSFVSKRGKDENSIWFLRVAAPGGEAFHIDGVEGEPVWSPDGRWIAYTKAADDGGEEKKPQKREGWIAPDAITNTLDAERFDGRVITQMNYKRDGVLTLLPHPSVRKKAQLFIVPSEGGEPKQITDLPFQVRGVEWAADAGYLLFNGNAKEDDEYNEEFTTDIYAVPFGGGEAKAITTNPGNETSPAVSPDGRLLVYMSTPDRGYETDIMIVEIAPDGSFAGEPRNITSDWPYRPGRPLWSPDAKAVRFSTVINGNSHLYEIPAAGGPVRQITTGDRNLRGFSFADDGALMAYSMTDPLTPPDLFLAAGDGGGEIRLTNLNADWLGEIALAPPERLTWKVADGTEIEGWLMRPVGYEPGNSYPMVLKIHGGPHSSYGNYWFRTFHILSASGFFVLYPNPRGSGGYPHDFVYATRGKWGELDTEDYLGGVDAALSRYPDIDPKRVGVSGGSYGGYMTNWLTATTDRFAAAVTSRSIADWETFYGTSDAQGLNEWELMGKPWEQRELQRRLSPLSYVENVKAPTLIIHSENDSRTPIADGETWFMYLKKLKVPVEFARYPRSSHGLSRIGEPWLLVDRLERLRTWFVHWLIEEPQAK
ncbi:MAG TPA: S9 family peptidase [Acidobacteriota bacterium]|nr:S9 family peptidase [Acidobacteriota bacterium]